MVLSTPCHLVIGEGLLRAMKGGWQFGDHSPRVWWESPRTLFCLLHCTKSKVWGLRRNAFLQG